MSDSQTHEISSYYDKVPYDSHPFAQTAPEHLEALAFLFGLGAAAPAKARVLELGCAAGGNLIPFAARHPKAKVVGIDISAVQVKQGMEIVEHAGLKNIKLRTFDISKIDASFGQFDYIICHGVYSWVPEHVQQAILRVCSENLAPDGIAYISYNIYPGWKSREVVRDAMMLRGGPRDTPEEKLAYARGMLEFLDQHAAPGGVLKKTLEEGMPMVRDGNPSYLLHEYLEPFNAPCYFKEFVARSNAQGLAYLADAELHTMFVQNYGSQVVDPLIAECGNSQVLMEQYLDFLVNRTFRQSLFVKQAKASQIRYKLERQRFHSLEFAGVFRCDDGTPITLDAREQLCNALRDKKVTLRDPAQKAFAQVFDERYPSSVPVSALVVEVAKRTGQVEAAVEPVVMDMLEDLLITGALRLRRTPIATATTVSAMPTVLAALRNAKQLELLSGATARITNQWHEYAEMSAVQRSLMPLLDGMHGHAALADFLWAEARAKRLIFFKDGQTVTDDQQMQDFSHEQLAFALEDLLRKGVLVKAVALAS